MNNVKIKKRDKAAETIRRNQDVFKCPVCRKDMHLNDSYSLLCNSNHCYDISRSGYINMLTSSSKLVYSKELFAARHKVCSLGFYQPLIQNLAQIIKKYIDAAGDQNEINILDAGCGEGSHLYNLYEIIKDDLKFNLIGVDISKEGIHVAASSSNDIMWTVADLTKLPIKNKSIDVILNILSPANYPEFERILSRGGIIIKVIPGKFYLKELRDAFSKNKNYSNDRVADYFSDKLQLLSTQNICYSFPIDEEFLQDIIKMTPLTWGVDAEREINLQNIKIKSITVDLMVLVGKAQ